MPHSETVALDKKARFGLISIFRDALESNTNLDYFTAVGVSPFPNDTF